eukprot:237610-Pleurochrysis_carterae.AAC.1
MAGVVPTCHAVLVAGAARARIVRALRAQRVCPCGAWVSVPHALPPTHRAVSVQVCLVCASGTLMPRMACG